MLKIDLALERLLTKVLFFSLFGVTLVVTPFTTNDPFNLPKMCVLAVCGLFILGGVISNMRDVLQNHSKAIFVILGLLVLDILVIVATTKPSLTEQLYGLFGRNTGALTYISLVGILAGGIVLSSENKIESFAKITLIIGFISSVYGHFQYFGIEPFPYVSIYERNVFSTFGNSNFQSAFMAMIAAMSCALAFKSGVSHWYRIGVSLFSTSCIFGIYETSAQQGFLSLLFALCVVAIVFLINRKYYFLGGISFLGIASAFILVLLSIFNVGLKIDFLSNASVVARKFFWESAANIIISHPLLGVGMDGFGDWYLRERSAAAVEFNAGLTTDAAHNVALDLGVSGGIPLLALYLAIISFTIRAIYRISRRDQHISANFYGLIGLWVAFQVQSLVSINQIGIAIWGWVSSGLIIGYEMNSASSSHSLKQKHSVSTPSGKLPLRANSVLGVFAGSLVGVMLVAPAYLSANNYFRALKTGDPSIIFKSAGIFPHERHRFLQVSSSMLNSGLNEEALYVARIAIKQYPDSIQSWILLKTIPTATESEKEQASSEIKRLDPLKP